MSVPRPLRSLRNRLTLIFALIVAGAIGIVYFYVTPRLEEQLVQQKLTRLAASASRESELIKDEITSHDQKRIEAKTLEAATRANAEVTTLTVSKAGDQVIAVADSNPGRVYTRDMLLSRVWGDSAYRDPRTIDVHVRHLREKIEPDPSEPHYLFTVRGLSLIHI